MRTLLLILALASTAFAQPAEPPLVTTPDFTIALPAERDIHAAGFADDGRSIHLVLRARELDYWSLLSWHWPEFLAIALIVLAARPLFRLVRRRQEPGHDYCAKCNYDLHNLE